MENSIRHSEAICKSLLKHKFCGNLAKGATKPSSKASHSIEGAYHHYSHLKKGKDYGHQAVGITLSCGDLTLNYALILYDKSKSKIQIVREIAEELPQAHGNQFP